MHKLKTAILKVVISMITTFLCFDISFGATQDQYPWTQVLQKVFDSLSGPVAYITAGIAVVGCGLAMAFLDLQGGAKKFVNVALGVSIAFGCSTILTTLFTIPGAVI